MGVVPPNEQSDDRTVVPQQLLGSGWNRGYGSYGSDPNEDVVESLLMEDRVLAASRYAEKIGLGRMAERLSQQNLIAAESATRLHGKKLDLTSDLAIEFIPDELGTQIQPIAALCEQLVKRESERFGWRGGVKVLITILPKEFDAPWATSRYGYCAPRVPYYKIGIPHHALVPERLHRVLTHEFAHVISESESKNRIPKWVSEGFSVYASNDFSPRAREIFLRNPKQWLDQHGIAIALGPGVDLDTPEKGMAYQQSGRIVRYLTSLKGEKELIRFLAEYADGAILKNLEIAILGETRTAEALHAIYGMRERDVFAESYELMRRE